MKYVIKYAPEGDVRLKGGSYKELTDEVLELDFDKSVIYDLGANIFDHSVYFAKKFPDSTIYAFEPIRQYFDMGIKNIEDHGVKNIIPIMEGVGDVASTFDIEIAGEGSSIVGSGTASDTEKVAITVIDDIIEKDNLKIPTFIKLDVEGFEANAIMGMMKTIIKHKPALWIEFHPHLIDINMEEMISAAEKIIELGYGCTHFKNSPTEIMFEYGKGDKDIVKIVKSMYGNRRRKIRNLYDVSTSKDELKSLKKHFDKYKKYSKLSDGLVWSRLYRVFTFKKAK